MSAEHTRKLFSWGAAGFSFTEREFISSTISIIHARDTGKRVGEN